MIGKTIAHYEVREQIGTGGMGAVFRAFDCKLHREVALKLLPKDFASNQERLDRFKREALAIASLNHPNIVTIFAVEEIEGQSLIVMELVKGRPLNSVIPKGGFAIERFLEIGIALSEALATAHEKGITHRDLKPANVMIEDSGRVKVIDFGLAKQALSSDSEHLSQLPTASITLEGRILGTPSYMSPEQVDGKAVDHRSDIFSLGILFHEMLTSERPFKGGSNISIMSAILKDSAVPISELRPDIPREISRVIRRCLHKNADERFQSAIEVRNELREVQTDFLTGSITSLKHTAPNPSSKSKPAITAAFALLVILGGLAAFKLLSDKTKKTNQTPSTLATPSA